MRAVWAFLLLAVGCGGEVRKDDSVDPDASGAGGHGAVENGGGTGLSSTTLSGCHRGFEPSDQTSRPCDFLADGLCYESKLDACACICPNRSNTNCVSGFPVPGGRVVVTCQ